MSSRARKKKPKVKKVTFKDKSWFEIVTPKIFNFKPIGEIIGIEDNIMGRTVENLLYDFTMKYSDISLKLKFRINEVNNEAKKCNTIFIGHQYTNDFIRSLIGRGSSKIQTILNLTTKDKYVFRITTICTTLKRARNSQIVLIRKIMREILLEFAKSLNHEKFIAGIIYGEFQNQIQRVAKTIYPLTNCVIVKSKLITIPEGGEDKVIPDDQFDIVEVEVQRSRKSEIRRSERINVKKLAQSKANVASSEEKEEGFSSDIDGNNELEEETS
ncbi:MAG: 30S ribosomal protein S3ae [Candidatus Hermodarchaeota archaeon]